MNRKALLLDAAHCFNELQKVYREFLLEDRLTDSLGYQTQGLLVNVQLGSLIGALKNLKPSLNEHSTRTKIEAALIQSTLTWKTIKNLLQ